MNESCDLDAVEAFARGKTLPNQQKIEQHLAHCEACSSELRWFRAEKAIFSEQASEAPSLDALWKGIEARIEPEKTKGISPYRTASPPAAERKKTQWRAFVVGALAATMVLVGGIALSMLSKTRNEAVSRTVRRSRVASPPQHAAVPVVGMVTLRLETWSAEVQLRGSARAELRAEVRDAAEKPQFFANPDGSYALRFNGGRLSRGIVEIEIPVGSRVEATSASGDVSIDGLEGSARVETVSGSIRINRIRAAEIVTSAGDVSVLDVSEMLRIRSVSGDIRVAHTGRSPTVSVESSSGDVVFAGRCSEQCGLGVRTVSGDVTLRTAADRSFSLRFTSISGELISAIGGVITAESTRGSPVLFGEGTGLITVSTTSGALTLQANE